MMSLPRHVSFPIYVASDYDANGIPNCFSNSRASASVSAVVTILISIPCVRFTLSGLISGKIVCSFNPSV